MASSNQPGLAARHDHMTMSISDNMNVGTINVLWIPQVYWIFVGSVIAAFALANVLNQLLFRQRIRAARRNMVLPAKPKTYFWSIHATLTALAREMGNFSSRSFRLWRITFIQPTFGGLLLVLANAVLLVTLCLYAINLSDILQFQNLGYRAGFVSLGQIPLIFLLAGKNNVIGWVTGSSYERLNYLHRWVARTLLLTTTIHMSWWFRDWAPYNFIGTQIKYDPTTQRGLIAWAILVWITFSSFAPIRGWSYEVFVVQHILSYVAFITMLFLHTPTSDHAWLWAPVAIYLFDRTVRALYTVYTNLSVFHPKQKSQSLWACRAELTPLPHNVTRVTVRNPPIQWQPGQHALFSCHSVVPFQSHPFTISSLPQDGKLDFIVKAHRGGTRRILARAEKLVGLPSQEDASSATTVPVVIEGPFGRIRPLRQFDSVVLITGSTGASFTIPLLRDIVRHWKEMASGESLSKPSLFNVLKAPSGAATRWIHFVWAIKSREQISWFSRELAEVAQDVSLLRKQGMDVGCDISIYITCDEALTSHSIKSSGSSDNKASPRWLEQTNPPTYEKLDAVSPLSEKKDAPKAVEPNEEVSVKEIDSRLESRQAPTTCDDGVCCCRSPDTPADADIICTCNDSASSSLSDAKNLLRTISPHPSITVRTGRPSPRHIIRNTLELARGESGVVSCGPRSLNEECRRSVVSLSDERAACKGTGAMGVYYWGEGFGYA